MKNLFVLCLALSILVVTLFYAAGISGAQNTAQRQEKETETQSVREHQKWVDHSLERMLTIKPGMTRAELMKVFTTEGGLSTREWQTFVYDECPHFKVDVTFNVVGDQARDRDGRVVYAESPADTIKSISRPYIDWSIMD